MRKLDTQQFIKHMISMYQRILKHSFKINRYHVIFSHIVFSKVNETNKEDLEF